MSPAPRRHDTRPVFMIGVAAEMAGMHPQTLRMYERRGLVSPGRTKGHTRLYSEADLAQLRRIQSLSEVGLNLAGIDRVMTLEHDLARALARVARLERELEGQAVAHVHASLAVRGGVSADIVRIRRVAGPPAVRVQPIIPAGLRPVPRAGSAGDQRRSN